MNWKYCVMRNVKPARVKNPVVIDPLAAVKRRLRKRLTSSIGWSMPRSTLTKIARMASPPAIVASVAPEPHPQFGPWMMPSTRAAMPALESTTPRQAGGAEHPEPDEQDLFAAEPVAEASRREDEGGKDQRVGIDHPLEVRRRSVELADQAW